MRIWRRDWCFVPSRSWRAMTRSSPPKSASRMSPTMPISKSQASIRISRDLLN
jgi:hypothetical protein